MWKLGAALAALVLGAVAGAAMVRSSQAQEASGQAEAERGTCEEVRIEYRSVDDTRLRRLPFLKDIPLLQEVEVKEVKEDKGVPILEDIPLLQHMFLQRAMNKNGTTVVQAAPAQFIMPHAAPGTWQLHSHGDQLVLLNTTDGRAFRLDGEGERAAWKPLPAPPRGAAPMAATMMRETAKPAEADATAMRRQVAVLETRLKDLREQLAKIEEGLDNAGNDREREELNRRAAEVREERQKTSAQLRSARERLKAAESRR